MNNAPFEESKKLRRRFLHLQEKMGCHPVPYKELVSEFGLPNQKELSHIGTLVGKELSSILFFLPFAFYGFLAFATFFAILADPYVFIFVLANLAWLTPLAVFYLSTYYGRSVANLYKTRLLDPNVAVTPSIGIQRVSDCLLLSTSAWRLAAIIYFVLEFLLLCFASLLHPQNSVYVYISLFWTTLTKCVLLYFVSALGATIGARRSILTHPNRMIFSAFEVFEDIFSSILRLIGATFLVLLGTVCIVAPVLPLVLAYMIVGDTRGVLRDLGRKKNGWFPDEYALEPKRDWIKLTRFGEHNQTQSAEVEKSH